MAASLVYQNNRFLSNLSISKSCPGRKRTGSVGLTNLKSFG